MSAEDPIFHKDGKYYFWDETWSNEHGPYDSRQEAETQFYIYRMWLKNGTNEKGQ